MYVYIYIYIYVYIYIYIYIYTYVYTKYCYISLTHNGNTMTVLNVLDASQDFGKAEVLDTSLKLLFEIEALESQVQRSQARVCWLNRNNFE